MTTYKEQPMKHILISFGKTWLLPLLVAGVLLLGMAANADAQTSPKWQLMDYHQSATLGWSRSEEHTSELQSHSDLVCRLLLEKKKTLVKTPMECAMR